MSELDIKQPLEAVARQIEADAKKSDDYILSAAMLVCEARSRVDAREAGDITWTAWAAQNIDLSQSRLRELQLIGETDDPEQALAHQRRRTRERVQNYRARKDAAAWKRDKERAELIAWAKTADLVEVRQVLKQVGHQTDDAPAVLVQTNATEQQQAA